MAGHKQLEGLLGDVLSSGSPITASEAFLPPQSAVQRQELSVSGGQTAVHKLRQTSEIRDEISQETIPSPKEGSSSSSTRMFIRGKSIESTLAPEAAINIFETIKKSEEKVKRFSRLGALPSNFTDWQSFC